MKPTRRDLLQGGAAASLLAIWPLPLGALGRAADRARDRRILLLFLEGGNDGLNTVVPVDDPRYHDARPRIALRAGLHRIEDGVALHPALGDWVRHYRAGRIAILPRVGYLPPNRSHFVSRDIWHSALPASVVAGARYAGGVRGALTGWVGRSVGHQPAATMPPAAIGVSETPLVLRGGKRPPLTLPEDGRLRLREVAGAPAVERAALRKVAGDTGTGAARELAAAAREALEVVARFENAEAGGPVTGWPSSRIAGRLRAAARLVRMPEGPPVIWTRLGGFDTHAMQPAAHAALLGRLGAATSALLDDLGSDGTLRRTLVLIYSEFGRRVRENGSQGTDHGAAGPVFLLGHEEALRAGVHGACDLADLLDGDLRPVVDFRAVYDVLARFAPGVLSRFPAHAGLELLAGPA